MTSDGRKPRFRKPTTRTPATNPEELFQQLRRRAKSHAYLRGEQQELLRMYQALPADTANVAFELPTGTGKTTVGLLIAEWQRQTTGRRAAYLTLTNQLARQVLEEAQRLGIRCANLIGSREKRNSAEEGLYRAAEAIAVTSYSNLFNVRPVIEDSQVIVFDDAHGGEQYVSDNWTVRISKAREQSLFTAALAALRSAITEAQVRAILNPEGFSVVEIVDVHSYPECITQITELLDHTSIEAVTYPWKQIRDQLHACLFLVSSDTVVIRPLIPPTETSHAFHSTHQRIFLSATLGSDADLQRAYGVESVTLLRVIHPQWGRRYVFAPGLHGDERAITADVWDRISPKRCVLLAPSTRIADRTFTELAERFKTPPTRVTSIDIAESLAPFTASENAMLVLAGRYDGLDFPDQDCRLLIMAESPAAVAELERHLRDKWKLGPVLRARERTRLIQGMGRCTRSATDFSVILWTGQSMLTTATSRLVPSLPLDILAEVNWGLKQSELARDAPGDLVDMICGLLEDEHYRNQADSAIDEVRSGLPSAHEPTTQETGKDEVRYARSLWQGDLTTAYAAARSIADRLTQADLTGARAWWWFLASVVALLANDHEAEQDCLRRALACGVNRGWLDAIVRRRSKRWAPDKVETPPEVVANAQGIWDAFEEWGWAGTRFEQKLYEMRSGLKQSRYTIFQVALELLGRCLGLDPERPNVPGAPDLVWSVGTDHIAFEVKTEKTSDGLLSKRELLESRGHIAWKRSQLGEEAGQHTVNVVLVASTWRLHDLAAPHAEGIYYLHPDALRDLANGAAESLTRLRFKYAGREFGGAREEFAAELRSFSLDSDAIWTLLKSKLLTNCR